MIPETVLRYRFQWSKTIWLSQCLGLDVGFSTFKLCELVCLFCHPSNGVLPTSSSFQCMKWANKNRDVLRQGWGLESAPRTQEFWIHPGQVPNSTCKQLPGFGPAGPLALWEVTSSRSAGPLCITISLLSHRWQPKKRVWLKLSIFNCQLCDDIQAPDEQLLQTVAVATAAAATIPIIAT